MISNVKLITFLFLLGLVTGQAPKGEGRDKSFLTPLTPRRERRQPREERRPSRDEGRPPRGEDTAPRDKVRSTCRRLKFRTLTGRCTHKFDEILGEARRVHLSYFNVDSRVMAGAELRSPRKISNIVCNQDVDVFSARHLNDLFTFFGQFIDHNTALTPLSDEEAPIPEDSGEHEEESAPEEEEEEELPFRRSVRALVGNGDAERPVNILPSAVDLVAVYGPNELRNEALRVPGSCKLKTSTGNLLPFNTGGFENSPSADRPEFYFAGDTRSNEHPMLTAIHTLWVREHNYLCDALAKKFLFSSAENLYENARRINIAQFQKIVYEEFFPAITGRRLSRFRRFSRRANPTLSSVFSTAAFRVGHTLVNDRITEISETGQITTTPLRDSFFVPGSVAAGIDSFIRGAAQTKAQEIDVLVVDGLRNFLFLDVEDEEGPDLIALNLQRSRDHNIPSFNAVRRRFGIRPANTFSEITRDPAIQSRLEKAYDSVEDVEPWIGMMAEDKMPDSSMGITMFKVWELEFSRLRDGDQFFYLGRKGLPRSLRRECPEIIDPILDPDAKIFKDIIVRNTDIPLEDLNVDDIFKTTKA